MPTKLGQNFLKDTTVVSKIIEAADLTSDDVVLEVGPGTGILTEALADHAGKVIAVELDGELRNQLRNKLRSNKNIEIIEGDILKINLPKILESHKLQTKSYKLIANIPYYITSPIIRLFLETPYPPKEMILMVQKEVAERIVAKPGEMSILSVSVQYYADAKILFEVSKDCFAPKPEVDSAIIRIRNYESGIRNQEEIKKFFRVVRAGFSAKRKTLVNNLANGFHVEKNEVEEKIISLGFNPLVRAQELSVEDWKILAQAFIGKK